MPDAAVETAFGEADDNTPDGRGHDEVRRIDDLPDRLDPLGGLAWVPDRFPRQKYLQVRIVELIQHRLAKGSAFAEFAHPVQESAFAEIFGRSREDLPESVLSNCAHSGTPFLE